MKESIKTTGGKFSTSRMLVDYMEKLYIPLCDLTTKYYSDLSNVAQFNDWKKKVSSSWNKIEITQENGQNINNKTIEAGNTITVKCKVKLPNISIDNVEVQVYCGQILDNGKLDNVCIKDMKLNNYDENESIGSYEAEIELKSGGNFGYTFRAMPKHEMLLESANLNLVKWMEK